jgi:hypothetical protein
MKFFATTTTGKSARNLKEIFLQTTPGELRQVAVFLEDCAKRMESSKRFGHAHLQDIGPEPLKNAVRQGTEPDVIVVQMGHVHPDFAGGDGIQP